LHTIEEKDNQVFALDYRDDGMMFATAGKDTVVRLYDEATKTETCAMKGTAGYGATQSSGHSNRIFSLKFSPDDPNILASGGWDNTVHFWDTRAGTSIRSIFGPHLCGDSLDLCSAGNSTTVLTGSWRPHSPLETWDLGTGKLIEQIEWKDSILGSSPCLLYAAQFSKTHHGRFIAAGGSGSNEARVFDRFGDSGPRGADDLTALVGTVTGMPRGVFSLDWSPVADKVAIGTGDGSIRIMSVVDRTGDATLLDVSHEAKHSN
jgi:WD40 repeat protein